MRGSSQKMKRQDRKGDLLDKNFLKGGDFVENNDLSLQIP